MMKASPLQPPVVQRGFPGTAWFLLLAVTAEILLTVPILLHDLGPTELNRFALFGILQFPYVLSLAVLVFVPNALARDLAFGVAMGVSAFAAFAEAMLTVGATLLWSWTFKDDPGKFLWLVTVLA